MTSRIGITREDGESSVATAEDEMTRGLSEREQFNHWFREEHERITQEQEAAHTPSMVIVATKGTLDWAYPPFILSTTAAALGWDVSIFFSFYGLELLKKDLDLKVSPLGNPAMPMKMPVGPEWFRGINWNIPNAVMGNVPGFESMTKGLFERTLSNHGVATINELRQMAVEAEVNLIACQMTVELFGYKQDEFIPEINEWSGAASMLSLSQEADVTLFI